MRFIRKAMAQVFAFFEKLRKQSLVCGRPASRNNGGLNLWGLIRFRLARGRKATGHYGVYS